MSIIKSDTSLQAFCLEHNTQAVLYKIPRKGWGWQAVVTVDDETSFSAYGTTRQNALEELALIIEDYQEN